MEIIVVVNGQERVLDAEAYGITEQSTESQVLSSLNAVLSEIASDVPFQCKRVISKRTAVTPAGETVEEDEVKFFLYPNAPAGCN